MNRFSETLHRLATRQVACPGIELIHASHSRWPLPSHLEVSSDTSPEHDSPHSLAVSVLDSSFNPPTMAHLALSRIPLPSPGPRDVDSTAPSDDFDAQLLLFSIKNVDKALKPGDASHFQRLEMIVLLANELEWAQKTNGAHGRQNVAVAVCQEPTFVGKSTALRQFLRERLSVVSSRRRDPAIQLTFLVGFDTLERLFAARYYGSDLAMNAALRNFFSSSGDNSRVICGRRSAGVSYAQTDAGVPDAAAEFLESGAVILVDIGESERSLSSSEVRENISSSKDGWEHKVPNSVAEYIKENNLYKILE